MSPKTSPRTPVHGNSLSPYWPQVSPPYFIMGLVLCQAPASDFFPSISSLVTISTLLLFAMFWPLCPCLRLTSRAPCTSKMCGRQSLELSGLSLTCLLNAWYQVVPMCLMAEASSSIQNHYVCVAHVRSDGYMRMEYTESWYLPIWNKFQAKDFQVFLMKLSVPLRTLYFLAT